MSTFPLLTISETFRKSTIEPRKQQRADAVHPATLVGRSRAFRVGRRREIPAQDSEEVSEPPSPPSPISSSSTPSSLPAPLPPRPKPKSPRDTPSFAKSKATQWTWWAFEVVKPATPAGAANDCVRSSPCAPAPSPPPPLPPLSCLAAACLDFAPTLRALRRSEGVVEIWTKPLATCWILRPPKKLPATRAAYCEDRRVSTILCNGVLSVAPLPFAFPFAFALLSAPLAAASAPPSFAAIITVARASNAETRSTTPLLVRRCLLSCSTSMTEEPLSSPFPAPSSASMIVATQVGSSSPRLLKSNVSAASRSSSVLFDSHGD